MAQPIEEEKKQEEDEEQKKEVKCSTSRPSHNQDGLLIKDGKVPFHFVSHDLKKPAQIADEELKDNVVDDGINTSNERSAVREEEKDDVSSHTAVFCRFCWDYSNTIEDPLLSVCKCSGGVGFVHYSCVKHWISTKMTEHRTPVSITKCWQSFGCEICHQIYPYVFKAHGRKYPLIDLRKPKDNYIVLESLCLENSTSRMVQILMPLLSNQTFKVGRGIDQEIRVADVSVSREHAKIKFQQNKFYLEDNLSKFGTVVLVKKQIEIFPGMFRQFQIGRSVVNVHMTYQEPRQVKDSRKLYGDKIQQIKD